MHSLSRLLAASLALLMLSSCGDEVPGGEARQRTSAPATATQAEGADSMASRDAASGRGPETAMTDSEERPVMQAQVVLERLGFGTGVMDGEFGQSFANALSGFQESRDLPVTGKLDAATRAALAQWKDIPATRVVRIPQSWADVRFSEIPEGMAAKAEQDRLGYETMAEKLAERFHTTPEVLARLNPGGEPARAGRAAASPAPQGQAEDDDGARPQYAPGRLVRVPNVGTDRIDPSAVDDPEWLATLRSLGVGTDQPRVERIVVDESGGWLKGYDEQGRLVAMFTVTTGSRHDPLPIGDWQVKGVAYNPPFAFDPELFWDVPDDVEAERLPPGPNGPVGVVWIDLDKEHYGIHGTPAPETIGRAESHGCVRLTNWDAARLAEMVGPGTEVVFRR